MCMPFAGEPPSNYPYISDDEGSIYRNELGVYRGSQPGFYNNNPVIFENRPGFEAFANNPLAYVQGGLTENKGVLGSFGDAAKGSTHLVVYGNPKTNKPSSWILYKWRGTGQKWPNLNSEIYKWLPVPNVREAQNKAGLEKNLDAFRRSRKVIPQISNPPQ